MGQNHLTSSEASSNRVLVIERVFDVPRRLVFEAWTKKEHVDRWSAPKGFTIPSSTGDLRPGGEWSTCMRSCDGTEFRLRGVYRKIQGDELLVFTHAREEGDGTIGPETVATVRLADEGGRTRMTFEQGVFATKEARDQHAQRWAECLDRLVDMLAQAGDSRR